MQPFSLALKTTKKIFFFLNAQITFQSQFPLALKTRHLSLCKVSFHWHWKQQNQHLSLCKVSFHWHWKRQNTAFTTLQSQFSLALKTTKHGIYHFAKSVSTGTENRQNTAFTSMQSQFSLALKTTKHGIYHFAKSVSTGTENAKHCIYQFAKLKITCRNPKEFTLHCSVGISTGQHPTADPSWVQGTQVRPW